MYFYEEVSLRTLERTMQEVPDFLPRGQGIRILCQTECMVRECGSMDRKELVMEVMSNIRYPPLFERLGRYLGEDGRKLMDFKHEKHRMTFERAVEKKNQKNAALMSALYLLTADHRLWRAAEGAVRRNRVCFEQIRLKGSTEEGYALYCAAKDLYLGTKNLTVRDLADPEVITPKLFGLICNGMAVRRFGVEAIRSHEGRRNEN